MTDQCEFVVFNQQRVHHDQSAHGLCKHGSQSRACHSETGAPHRKGETEHFVAVGRVNQNPIKEDVQEAHEDVGQTRNFYLSGASQHACRDEIKDEARQTERKDEEISGGVLMQVRIAADPTRQIRADQSAD